VVQEKGDLPNSIEMLLLFDEEHKEHLHFLGLVSPDGTDILVTHNKLGK